MTDHPIDIDAAEATVSGRAELTSAAWICFCAGGLYGWSALVPVIETLYGGTTAQAGLVFSIAIVAFTVAVIVAPRLPHQFIGLKGCVLFGLLGAAFLVLAMHASTYPIFLFSFGVGFGMASGAIYINALGVAANAARSAVVTPLMVASFGLGGVVFALVWRWLIVNDWSAFVLLPLLLALLLACCVGWFVALRMNAASTAANSAVWNAQVNARTPLRNSTRVGRARVPRLTVLALLWVSFALGSAGGLMVLGLAGKITESAGASASITTLAIAGVALGNTIGRASVGGINAWLKPINTALLAVLIGVVGLIVTTLATSAILIATGIIIVATGYGAVASTIPVLVGDLFGKANFSKLYSMIFTAWGMAGLLSPWLAGAIHDRTGDFRAALVLALLATIGSFLALLTLKLKACKRG